MRVKIARHIRRALIAGLISTAVCYPARHGFAQSGAILEDTPLPPAVASALIEAVNQPGTFRFESIDERQPVPSGRGALVWAGSEATTMTGIVSFVVRLESESTGDTALPPPPPTEVEFLFDEGSVTVRPWRPVRREFVGGVRFQRRGRGLRRAVVRVEGGRELAVFAPPIPSDGAGVGLVVCLTALEQRSSRKDSPDPRDLLVVPRRDLFKVGASRVTPRGVIDGRVTSGILPARAQAELAFTPNIAPSIQESDSTVSRDPLIGVIYSPQTTPTFVAGRPTGMFGAIRATAMLETPAGHRQITQTESRVWFERLDGAVTAVAGGTDSVPKAIVERYPDLSHTGPVYGSCFGVAEQQRTARTFFDAPTPTAEPGVPS